MRGQQGSSSTFDIGAPIESYMKNSSANGSINLGLYNDFFWSTSTQGFALNNTLDSQSSFAFTSPQYTIFDSGTSQILLPSSIFQTFTKEVLKANGNPNYSVRDGMILIECNTTPHVSVFWMVAYYWLEILPEDYIVDVSAKGDGSVCMLQFKANIYDFIVLGTPILQNYYVTFDMENSTATFIPNAWTRKGYLKLDRNLPSRKIEV